VAADSAAVGSVVAAAGSGGRWRGVERAAQFHSRFDPIHDN
jgi:hypothetical protein